MITLARAADRFHSRIGGWLDSRHSFSFGQHHDPDRLGFRSLKVINEDHVAPGGGFPPHPHRDMEILSYVLSGGLAHRDSLGTGSTIRPGEVQLMSAGSGIRHSEMNASGTEPVHFLQIWIEPDRPGGAPGYQQKAFPAAERADRLRLVAAPAGEEGSLTLNADARLYAGTLGAGRSLSQPLAPGRHAWLHVIRGAAEVNGHAVATGDGLAFSDEAAVVIGAGAETELLLFDLA